MEIPIELIEEVLLRLPVVDILRFRCVSKKWRNLIDSPNFVQSHLNLPNKPRSVLVIDEQDSIYYFPLDSVSNANSPANLLEFGELCSEIYTDNDGILGQINGLVCCLCDRDLGVILWNPWTMKHIQVPPPEERSRIRPEQVLMFRSWGFGYDKDSDDYKVITLACLMKVSDPSSRTLVWIYSLRSGSWTSLDDCPFSLSYDQDVVFFNGSFYFTVDSHSDGRRSCSLCAFDLAKLEYNLVPAPNLSGGGYFGHLGVLDGCLLATCCVRGCMDVDLWVMKESWTLLMHYHRPMIPLAYIRNGCELLFVTSDEVMSYELKTRSVKRVIRDSASYFKSVVCVPSLVCPRSDLVPGNS